MTARTLTVLVSLLGLASSSVSLAGDSRVSEGGHLTASQQTFSQLPNDDSAAGRDAGVEVFTVPGGIDLRAASEETAPWGIDLVICLVSARLSGSSMGEAMGQCSARVP